ncbi:cadherin-1-like [Sardina pilchardus]|uniref:cadherin-1-like n=1 Tax=Sardina pilchardus TaxID=27697 RepID=UPI002E0E64DD
MLLYMILALGVVTGVHADADVLSSQPGQDSGPALVQDEAPLNVEDVGGNSKISHMLKRRKREWIIPPINFPENSRGPFPKRMVQIKTSFNKELNMVYSITGPGADQPPRGLFTIDRDSGWLYVTQPLDREQQASYLLLARAVSVSGRTAEDPMNIMITIIDQNDNKPVFKQAPFLGKVSDASKIGFEFMTVAATDADEPGNANSEIRYKILSQDPPLPSKDVFEINPVTGKIRVNAAGLDSEKIAEYTLEIQAADYEGDGLAATSKAIITVTDRNDQVLDGLSYPYTVELINQDHWKTEMNTAGTGAVLKLKPTLLQRDFNIVLRVCDSGGICKNSTILAQVDDCNCLIKGSFCINKP